MCEEIAINSRHGIGSISHLAKNLQSKGHPMDLEDPVPDTIQIGFSFCNTYQQNTPFADTYYTKYKVQPIKIRYCFILIKVSDYSCNSELIGKN